ncbi:phospholipase D family protein [Micromonospora musae]|uniref:phospholipase D family protein n=1 Tax=Micromonospora musae TaxID=1894970 RepID=UPI0034129A79
MLLPPDGRALLTDVLRPPQGFRLDRAVATTFSLELDSLLAAPLAFTAHALRDRDDPISVMEGVRRCADRIDVFCQAGQIAPPPGNSGLLLLLEQAIHPVRSPRPGRLFHPKMWLVRYAGDGDRLLRLIVLSRNLTNDRSWDVCLSLDGVIGSRRDARNTPVVKLLRHAIDLATQPVPEARRAAIEELLEHLRRAMWELPEGFFRDELYFHALGVPGTRPPNFAGTRHLVMSPFVSADGFDVCAPGNRGLTVIGRQEELDRLPEGTLDGCAVLVLNDLAALDMEDETGPARLTGLHAKAYVVEYGRRARVIVGSANATGAAFTGKSSYWSNWSDHGNGWASMRWPVTARTCERSLRSTSGAPSPSPTTTPAGNSRPIYAASPPSRSTPPSALTTSHTSCTYALSKRCRRRPMDG